MSWDEDDTQVTPLELLQGVNDGGYASFRFAIISTYLCTKSRYLLKIRITDRIWN